MGFLNLRLRLSLVRLGLNLGSHLAHRILIRPLRQLHLCLRYVICFGLLNLTSVRRVKRLIPGRARGQIGRSVKHFAAIMSRVCRCKVLFVGKWRYCARIFRIVIDFARLTCLSVHLRIHLLHDHAHVIFLRLLNGCLKRNWTCSNAQIVTTAPFTLNLTASDRTLARWKQHHIYLVFVQMA